MKTKFMLRTPALSALLLSTLNPQLSTRFAQGTAFTYQGRRNDGAKPASGSYDLAFSVWNAASGPAQVGGTRTNGGGAFRNNGSGGFVSASTNTVGNNPFAAVVADVNGDGQPDLRKAPL